MSQHDFDCAYFAVWLINKLADAWDMSTPRVYRLLQGGDIVSGYILPFYDQLHSMGSEALVEDITELSRKRGLIV